MATEAQINANRQNAKKATGPRTAAGKATSSRNGIPRPPKTNQHLIDDEDPAEFMLLLQDLFNCFQPANLPETKLVTRIALDQLRLDRAMPLEAGIYRDRFHNVAQRDIARQIQHARAVRNAEEDGDPMPPPAIPPDPGDILARAFLADCEGPNAFIKLARYESHLERSIDRCLRELKILQAARRNPPDPAEPPPTPSAPPSSGTNPKNGGGASSDPAEPLAAGSAQAERAPVSTLSAPPVYTEEMAPFRLIALSVIGLSLSAQTNCNNTPAFTPCEFTFDLNPQEAAAHPNPYLDVDLSAEFRSPHFHTFKLPAFWDGGQRLIIRFTPTEPGEWLFRVSSNIQRWEGQSGSFTSAESGAPGFVRPANLHHWSWSAGDDAHGYPPHLWMGDTLFPFAFLDQALYERIVDARAAQKFNHIRGLVLGTPAQAARIFPSPDHPDIAHFQQLDQRIRYMNQKGIVADLILAGPENQLTRLFPTWQLRQRYISYMVARYAGMNVTWQGVESFETYDTGRALMKEIGTLLKTLDPYQHPRTSSNLATSGGLIDDGWMSFVTHHTGDDQVCAIERQLFPTPFVNLKFAGEDSGAGKSQPDDVDSDAFRHRLWNIVMDGDYPTYFNSGTAGAGNLPVDARYLDSPGAKAMTAWYSIFAGSRHWELEPYFEVDGGRAVAIPEVSQGGDVIDSVEYLVYVEKPAPVELRVQNHGYDVAWINPIDGEEIKEKKGYHGEHFTGSPPDSSHDWVLRVSREGHKEGMLKSYKFESRRIDMQVIEQEVQKVPFTIAEPADTAISETKLPFYEAKFKKETRATRSVMWLWTGECTVDGEGYRVLGTGPKGTVNFPPHIAINYPAVMDLRLYGMNANGKVYSVDKTYQLEK